MSHAGSVGLSFTLFGRNETGEVNEAPHFQLRPEKLIC